MRGLRIPLLIFIFCSFALGIYWGLKIRAIEMAEDPALKTKSRLRVLAYKGLLNPELLQRFTAERAIGIDLVEAANPEELWHLLETAPDDAAFDVVTLFSYQVPLASQMNRIVALDAGKVPRLSQVAADFRRIPGELSHGLVVPLLWGINGVAHSASVKEPPRRWSNLLGPAEKSQKARLHVPSSTADLQFLSALRDLSLGHTSSAQDSPQELQKKLQALTNSMTLGPDFLDPSASLAKEPTPEFVVMSHGQFSFLDQSKWKFVVPEEGGLFWILSLALVHNGSRSGEAHEFFDFMLSPEIAVKLSKTYRQATTLRGLPENVLAKELSPTQLRRISLQKLKLWQDFSRAREIREFIGPIKAASRP